MYTLRIISGAYIFLEKEMSNLMLIKKHFNKSSLYKYVFILDAVLAIVVIICVTLTGRPDPVTGAKVMYTSYNSVEIRWTESENIDGYNIYRSKDGGNYRRAGRTKTASFKDLDLTTGSKYLYKIQAYNGIRKGKTMDKPLEVNPCLEKPDVELKIIGDSITLNISKVDGSTGYEIYRDKELISSQKSTVYTDKNVKKNQKYLYEVRAERSVDDQSVYSDFSIAKEAAVIPVDNLKAKMTDDGILIKWKSSNEYTGYKLYDNEGLLTDTKENSYVIEDFYLDKEYEIKLVGYNKEAESSEITTKFKVREEKTGSTNAKDAACDWGVEIANDNSFMYGTGKRAHRSGCYFCGTNTGPNINRKGKSKVKGHSYEKTYCCNPFVTACYAHGAGDPGAMALCQKGRSYAMTEESFLENGSWKALGKPKMSKLERGDVLVGNKDIGKSRSHHMALYIGDGKIVHAAHGGWTKDSITVSNLSSGRYARFDFVMRYTGDSNSMDGVKYVLEEVK